MTIVVENGTGLENANSYTSVAFADEYFSTRGIEAWTGTDSVKEQALIRATDYIQQRWAFKFIGSQLTEEQALSWPRESAVLPNGVEIAEDVVPTQLQKATAEYALRALSSTLMPDPTLPTRDVIREKTIVGPIEEEFEYAAGGAVNIIQPYPAADALLTGLVTGLGSGQRRIVR